MRTLQLSLCLFFILLAFCCVKGAPRERFGASARQKKSVGFLPPQPRNHLPTIAPRDTKLIVYRSSSSSSKQGISSHDVPEDKRRMLYERHGATYHGQVHEDMLPNYHVLRVNQTSDALLDDLKTHLNAEWISHQRRVKRPLRSGDVDVDHYFSNIQNEYKRNAFKSILKRIVPKGDFEPSPKNRRRRGRQEMDAYDMEESDNEHDATLYQLFSEQQKEFQKEHKPWEIAKDPLFRDQWHIHGNKYRVFSFEKENKDTYQPTFHLNLAPVWYSKPAGDQGREIRTLGRGVVIAVVGDGINYFHSDLSSKFVDTLSVDITTDFFVSMDGYTAGLYGEEGDYNFLPYVPRTIRGANRTDYGMALLSQPHGTSVASIAAGSPDDGTCGSGVAPGALLSSIRLLGETHEVTELEEATALSYKCAVFRGEENTRYRGQENMIYLSSWGPSDGVSNQPVSMSDVTKDAIRACAEQGRSGYGSVYVQAAGNGKQGGDTMDIDGYASYRYMISVGAITYTGYPTFYSEGGESLMVVAPSSQGAMGITAASTIGSFYATRVSMLKRFLSQGKTTSNIGGQTIDIHKAYSSPLKDGCTSSFGGTSASAPMIAGLIALMLEANPALTWKDVHDILVQSAEKPHLEYSEASYIYRDEMVRSMIGNTDRRREKRDDLSPKSRPYLSEKIQENFFIFFQPPDPIEWLINDETGLHHSYLAGFGLPNGARAVSMARSRRINTQTESIRDDYRIVIPSEELTMHKRFWYTLNETEWRAGEEGKEKEEEEEYPQVMTHYEEGNNQVGYKEVGVWYVELDENNHEDAQQHTHRLYDKRKNLALVDPLTGGGEAHDRIGDMRIEQVELYINATLPASIDNIQLALCDYQKVCSIFLRGKNYDDTHLVQDHLDYTFTTVKHWGQRVGNTMRPGQGWSIMLRNNYPFRYAKVVVHAMELRIYGHFTGR